MKRIVVAPFLAAVLALAPVAVAKGPHATVDSGPAGLELGEPWVTTLTLFEYGRRAAMTARPTVVLRNRERRFSVVPKRLETSVSKHPNVFVEARYRLRVVFPRAGRWSYTVLDGTPANRRFRFPVATVGGNAERSTTGYVAFPQGSEAEAQGGGGPLDGGPRPVADAGGGALPPKVYEPPADVSDDNGAALLIPAGGLALAGLATLGLVRRRRRSE
jgi:MYXO-CTERM domain-containing protein